MFVLGTGAGEFDVTQHLDQLTFTNPPRRDVHHIPSRGWMVIAYPTDNVSLTTLSPETFDD